MIVTCYVDGKTPRIVSTFKNGDFWVHEGAYAFLLPRREAQIVNGLDSDLIKPSRGLYSNYWLEVQHAQYQRRLRSSRGQKSAKVVGEDALSILQAKETPKL